MECRGTDAQKGVSKHGAGVKRRQHVAPVKCSGRELRGTGPLRQRHWRSQSKLLKTLRNFCSTCTWACLVLLGLPQHHHHHHAQPSTYAAPSDAPQPAHGLLPLLSSFASCREIRASRPYLHLFQINLGLSRPQDLHDVCNVSLQRPYERWPTGREKGV